MTTTYTHFLDLAKEAQPPDKGTLSRTPFNDDRLKAAPSGFAALLERDAHERSRVAATPAPAPDLGE